jgi:hypothetical protein
VTTTEWADDEPINYALTDAAQEVLAITPGPRRLAAGPLLRQIALRGGDAACGVRAGSAEQKALERAREDGTLTLWAADRLAVRLLGLTIWDIWDL